MMRPMHVRLSTDALPSLDVPVPEYDRSAIVTGIVHIGVGGFHRAHQAAYLDALMREGEALDWGISGVGVLPADRRMKEALDAQDGLYTLVLKHPDGTYEPRVIGSITRFLLAPDDPAAVIEAMADERVRIVSLTVTEGGYNLNDITGEFDAENPDVVHDLEPGAAPRTTFGLVTAALRLRRERGVRPFTVMSCDNLEGNGDLSRRVFGAFARLRDPELGEWVEREVRFPNSMVDRITPQTTDADRDEVRERFGIDDAWPVVCEPFTQWVLEDEFGAGRPPYERVGVQVVQDVLPYELMKLRLLNASHQGLAYLGHLCGYPLPPHARQGPPVPGRLPARPRRGAGPAVPRVPARLHGRGGHADARAGARRRPRRLQAHPHRALLQPRGPRHHRPAGGRDLGPHPEVARAGHAAAARERWPDPALGGHRGELGALRRGR